jgi:hypothetical protein
MNQFVTLPSGLRVNTAHILEYREWTQGKTSVTQNVRDPEGGMIVFEEDMTAEQLDDILRGPAIVDSVVDLDKLEPGKACCFTMEGRKMHGVIHEICAMEGQPVVIAISDGKKYEYDL